MKIVEKPIGEIVPYPGNPRHNAAAVDGIAESIRRFGFRQPLVVDARGVVVCGHARLAAAKKLGETTVPCVLADDLPDDAIRAYRLLDNKLREKSSWDYDALAAELADLKFDFDAFDVDFDPPEFPEFDPAPSDDEPDKDATPRDPATTDAPEPGGIDALPSAFAIVVRCEDQKSQETLYRRLTDEGYDVRLCNM